MRYVVDKVALGQVFLEVLHFPPVSVIPLWLSKLTYLWGMNNKPVVAHMKLLTYAFFFHDLSLDKQY
jgi:hypothetical protein